MKTKVVILVVGEDASYVDSLGNALRKLGYVCHCSYSCSTAAQQVFEYYPDIIVYLPDGQFLSSLRLYNILKENTLTFDIPFILISSEIKKDEILVAFELGIDGVFDKTLKINDLQNIIDVRVKKQQRLRQESEQTFLKQFDYTLSPAAIFDSNYKIVSFNDTFKNTFSVNPDRCIWENLEYDADEFKHMSYKLLESNEGMAVFKYSVQLEGKSVEYTAIMSSLNTFFARKCAMLMFYNSNNISNIVKNMAYSIGAEGISLEGIGIMSPWGEELEDKSKLHHYNSKGSEAAIGGIYFTKRQLEVLELSILGLPMKQIADKLCISEKTVEKYRANLLEKTHSKNIIELVIFAIKNDLVRL